MSEVKKKSEQPVTTALATCQPTMSPALMRGMPVDSIADLVSVGELLARSGMFGNINPAAGFVIATTCHQSGMTLFDYNRTYHTIQNRPSMRADAMLAEFRKRGAKHRIVENSNERAAVEISYEGVTSTFQFTMDDARAAGYPYADKGKTTLKDNWKNNPAAMLWARCISIAVRRLCPEINAGIYTPEETQDFIDVDYSVTDRSEPRQATTSAAAAHIIEVMKAGTTEQPVEIVTVEQAGDAAEPAGDNIVIPEFPGDDNAIDYSVCPVGKKKGLKWDEFSIDELGLAIKSTHPEILPGHHHEIAAAANRKGIKWNR